MKDLKQIANKTHCVYEQEAESYALSRDTSLFEKKWLDLFISNLRSGAKVLDVGCGPAIPIAKYLIENKFDISGIDYSESMIKISKRNFPEHNWSVANMVNFQMNQKFDGIIAWNSFFHLSQPDQKKAIKLFSEHLEDNGILMFTAGPENGEVTGKVNGSEVYHSSLSTEEYRETLKRYGLEIIDFKLNDPECNYHSVYLALKK